jgi:Ca2+-binding RTX toxin-like protein
MKRVLLLVTVASMFAAAMVLSGVAQAAPISNKAEAQCVKLAILTQGSSFNPSNYTFHAGTAGDDTFDGQATAGPDVFCGFDGIDSITTLDAGDVFIGGAGDDFVINNNGVFDGGQGNDFVDNNNGLSLFFGGEGDDVVETNAPRAFFSGGFGNDVVFNNLGDFTGGPGDDSVGIGNPPVDGP